MQVCFADLRSLGQEDVLAFVAEPGVDSSLAFRALVARVQPLADVATLSACLRGTCGVVCTLRVGLTEAPFFQPLWPHRLPLAPRLRWAYCKTCWSDTWPRCRRSCLALWRSTRRTWPLCLRTPRRLRIAMRCSLAC